MNADIEMGPDKKGLPSFTMFGVSLPVMIVLIIGSLVALFVAVAAIIVGVHRIKEGNVGLYYKVRKRSGLFSTKLLN